MKKRKKKSLLDTVLMLDFETLMLNDLFNLKKRGKKKDPHKQWLGSMYGRKFR